MNPPTQGAQVDALLSEPLTLVVSLGLMGLLPFAFMTLTSFVKISTVLHITKSAIGAQSIPSTTVVMALSTALTLLVMAPVGSKIADRLTPALAGSQSSGQLVRTVFEASAEPVREFLHANTSAREKQRFLLLANKSDPARADTRATSDFPVVVPAFIISELGKAFALGFAIFLPFLVIDIVVGNVLMALGMQMMSPTQVSLPFKLLLFLMADGWGLLAQSLVSGYVTG
jgi:type III secretion protein R